MSRIADQLADAATTAPTPTDPYNKGRIDITPDGAEVKSVTVDQPIETDWTPVFALFNLDANVFEVVDDTVRMSTWQQSKGLEDGTRDVAQLYSYSARFRRITTETIPAATLTKWRSALVTSIVDREPPAPPAVGTLPATYSMFVADPQLGKKGTEESVENWRRGILEHCKRIRAMQAQGRPPEAVHVGWMGDETEGVCNNYGNQPHTIELNQSKQLELDYDMRVWTLRTVAELELPISASSVISNHGEWTRNGSKDPVTTRNDNASTHIARQVEKMFRELEPFGGPVIDWTIGDTTPGVLVNMSGVPAYMSHGYVEKGRGGSAELRTRQAIERQILGRTEELGAVPLWFMAHYHHLYTNEFEGRTLFGLSALEATRSSEYMLDQYGVWSPAGMAGLLVGAHTARRWSDLSVF